MVVRGDAQGGCVAVPEQAVSPTEAAGPRLEGHGLRSWYIDAAGKVETDLSPRALAAVRASGAGSLWVDIDTTQQHQVACLENVFGFHPLSVEDTLNPNSRVKLEEFPHYLFLIVRGVAYAEHTDEPYDTETFNLCFFLGRNFLVTTHGGIAPGVEDMVSRLRRSPDLLGRGAQRLMHALVDSAVDAYFPVVEKIDDFLDGLEQRVFTKFDEAALHDIFEVKRLILSLRRHLSPQREVLNILTNRPSPLLTPETQLYFRDIYDHVLRINDALDTYRELMSSTLDSYLSQVSIRLGRITTGLSVVATLSVPFVVISGMWGMNVAVVPLAHTPHAFWILVGGQLAVGLALVAMLRWRKWL